MTTSCPFCDLPINRILLRNDLGFVIRDAFPVSDGHTLIIPMRHVASFFETSHEERRALVELLDIAREDIETTYSPDGFNIGINDGAAAGQTVAHLHIHLIPRYDGDRSDPRGGVRWVIPEKAPYWTEQ